MKRNLLKMIKNKMKRSIKITIRKKGSKCGVKGVTTAKHNGKNY
jgi:hypothetical protein